MKEHPDPGSKDPEEDYPKFGLLDQVCDGRQEKGGELRGGGGPSGTFLLSQGADLCCEPVLCSSGGSPSTWSALLRLRVFPLTKSVQQII